MRYGSEQCFLKRPTFVVGAAKGRINFTSSEGGWVGEKIAAAREKMAGR